jgi:hypothetical protein
MRFGPAIFANVLLIVSAFGVGTLLDRLIPPSFQKVDRLAAILLGGLGSLGTLIFLVGMIHFSRVAVLAVLVPAAVMGICSFATKMARQYRSFRSPRGSTIPVLVVATVMTVTVLGGFAEPVGDFHTSDAIAYHYLGPRVWLRDAVIRPLPDECLTAFPAVVETLFASLLAVGGPRAMALFSATSLGLLLLVSYGFASRLKLNPSAAWWAAALVATMPAVYRGCYDGFIDAILWSFVLLSLRLALDGSGSRDFILAGLFSGLAMGTKYLALISFPLTLVCALSFHWRRRDSLSSLFYRFGLFAAVACVVASPWYIRNWIVLGCPIYPPTRLLVQFFKIRYMSTQAIYALGALLDLEGHGMGHDFISFILLPFRMAFHPANYLNGAGGVGLSFLALAPFGVMIRWRDSFAKAVTLFAFLWVIVWFLTEQDVRFLIHIFVIIAAFGIWGWQFVAQKAPRFGPFLAGFTIACSIIYGLIMIVPERAPDIRAAASLSYEQQRGYQRIPFLDSFTWLNHCPAVKKVLVLDPLVPTYYLKKDYLKPIGRHDEETLPAGIDLNWILTEPAKFGITHILDVDTSKRVMDAVRAGQGFRLSPTRPNLQLVFERGDQRVYRVSSEQ